MAPKIDVAKIVKAQEAIQEQIILLIKNFNKIEESKKTQSVIQVYQNQITLLWTKFQANHITIYENDQKNAQNYIKSTINEDTQFIVFEFLGKIKEKLIPIEPTKSPPQTQEQSFVLPKTELRLPPITIPTFDGSYRNWRSFYDLFKSMIYKDPTLPKVHKLHYLKSSVSGEAERLLKQFEITDENFDKAWELLEKRYNNKRVLVQNNLSRLFNYPKVKTESAYAVKNLLYQFEEMIHELNTLDVFTLTWDPILIHLMVQKLPNETIALWEQEIGGLTELPSYTEFVQFLESRFRTLEVLQQSQSFHTNPSTSLQYNKNANTQPPKQTRNFLNKSIQCMKCKLNHTIYKCDNFKKLTPQQRFNFAKQKNLCKNCLSINHKVQDCKSKYSCLNCHKRHHTLLHLDKLKQNTLQSNEKDSNKTSKFANTKTKPTINTNTNNTNATSNFFNTNSPHVLLATALVKAIGPNGKSTTLRALIDSGSQISFITKSASKKLNLKPVKTNIQVTGLEKTSTANVHQKATLEIKSLTSNFKTTINVLIVNEITDNIPSKEIQIDNLHFTKHLTLADPHFSNPGPVDLLLGAEVFCSIMESGFIKGNKNVPSAQATQLGWILMGPIPNSLNNKNIKNFLSNIQLDENLKRFWQTEEIQKTSQLSTEDQLCETLYKSTVKRDKNGKYEVTLPFKNNKKPELGKSKHIAVKQFFQLEQRFKKQPEFYNLYKECIHEYIQLGHMREIRSIDNSDEKNYNHYYLPHHAVLKESTTTKLRVVFNASSKSANGKSLNEQLMTGPTIQPTLWSTLLNWRKHKYALTADIEKMYRMININQSQQDYQRIVWRDDPKQPLKDYVLTTVTFGTTPAPYLAIRTLFQLANDEQEKFPLAAKVLKQNSYVDDLLCGADTIENTIQLQTDLIQLLKMGGFNLRKWTANNITILKNIPIENREIKTEFEISESESVKTLGIKWYPQSDDFTFSVKLPETKKNYTKRIVLSQIASLFDPLGWLAPIIIVPKILIQKLWLSGCEWDQTVPEPIYQEWIQFRTELPNIEKIRIPRWFNFLPNSKLELHGFCDASIQAYAAVIYFKVIHPNNDIYVTLLTSKTRVAPTKPVTLPRLELCGALLLANLISQVISDMKLDSIPVFAWTDSLITLAWIKGQPAKWKTYVANRVTEIQEKVLPICWYFIPGEQNPADVATRGISPNLLVNNKKWWYGPVWLKSSKENWPSQPVIPNPDIEVKKIKTFFTKIDNSFLTKFSTFQKLIRVIAFCLRFIINTRKPESKILYKYLTCSELNLAERKIITLIQKEVFSKEIKDLKTNKQVHRKSTILTLKPFLDEHNIIRVGGRIHQANLSYNTKHPIILPKHFVSNLIIDYIHTYTLHGGTDLVLNTLRNKYWLINARNIIKGRIRKCIQCFKANPKTSQQIMSNLPHSRVNMALPFQHTGVDFAGPLYFKSSKLRSAKSQKCYICLFICMTTKAIHLEIVTDLTAIGFVAALKRFVSRRGLCSDLYSDCGTNFVGAKKLLDAELAKALKENSDEISNQMAQLKISWHFNPPSAPHFGGIWEAGVKSVKTHLKRTIANTLLTLEEFNTLLCQIEACLNSRPLTPLSDDPNSECLTPGHFLTGRNIIAFPESKIPENQNVLKRWQHVQQLTQQFWKRWSSEYLHTLQQRSKWLIDSDNFKPDDLVIIKDERYPPTKWPVGRIIQVHPGLDNKVRVATIKISNSEVLRPITKLCKFPLHHEHDSNNKN